MGRTFAGLVCLAASLSVSTRVGAQFTLTDKEDKTPPEPRAFALPYAFYLSSTGLAAGAGAAAVGYGQPNFSLFGTGYYSVNGSYGLFFQGRNLQLNPIERLFLDGEVGSFEFAESDEYVDGNPAFSDERAGSSGSSQDNFVTAETLDVNGKLTFKYLLPIGNGKNEIIHRYWIQDGILEKNPSGGKSLNPMTSGRTFVHVIPFIRVRDLDPVDDEGVDQDFNTSGVRGAIRWDNTDFTVNPSNGNRFEFVISRDPGIGDSSGSWTNVTGEWQHFVPLGTSKYFQQQVLAMDAWTSQSTTFHYHSDGTISGAPPYYEGSWLGGINRMRGYPSFRFHDRAAVAGTAEFRLSPLWNPLGEVGVLKPFDIELVQLVAFGEIGEVAPNWKLDDLFSSMKWDAGVGLRIFAKRTLLRGDFAVSPESWQFRAFIGQAF